VSIAFVGASAAQARMLTYRNLTCEYALKLTDRETARTITITNVGAGTVVSNATYSVSRGASQYKFKLNRTLGPREQGSTYVGFNWPSPSKCAASAYWYVADEYKP
jgi:hypothetical protein